MFRGKCIGLTVLLFLLAGCAGQDSRDAAQGGWAEHRGRLQILRQWTASGKLALRTSDRAESATLVWQQHDHNIRLRLSGPMGAGATTIDSDGRQVNIRRGDELRKLDISTPEAIVLNTGWDLPLQALPHWLKGIPSPDYQIQFLELDPENNLLRRLRQDDWEVRYEQYDQFAGFTLPTRLRIQRGATRVRVIIRDWRILSS